MKKFQQNIANHYQRAESREHMANSTRALFERSINQLNGISHNGKRDIYEIYGYPQSLSGNNGFTSMYQLSRRMGFASRLVNGMPKSCWREGFELFESADDDAEKIFEDEIVALNKAGFNRAIEKADVLNRIGRFSVLFVGVPDGLEPDQPVGSVSPDKIDKIYFKPFAYDGIIIQKQNSDPKSPRFGKPEMYQVQRMSRGDTDKDINQRTLNVHWTRIIHLNENGLDSDVEGMGFLEPVYNRLLDFQKAVGGSAEAYFRNARRVMAAEMDPKFASELFNNPAAKKSFDDATQEFVNEQKDFLTLGGAKIQQLQASHASPLDTAKAILWEVSGYTGWPLRVLTGEGSGQLAGSEDQLAYNALVADRQNIFCSSLLVRLFEILQMAGMVKELPPTYVPRFPLQTVVSETQEVKNNDLRASSLQKVAAAIQTSGGSIDAESALEAVGLGDIEIDSFKDLNGDNE